MDGLEDVRVIFCYFYILYKLKVWKLYLSKINKYMYIYSIELVVVVFRRDVLVIRWDFKCGIRVVDFFYGSFLLMVVIGCWLDLVFVGIWF